MKKRDILLYILFVLLSLSLFVPEYLQTFSLISTYYQVSKVVIGFGLFLYLVISKKKLSAFNIVVISYFVYLTLITFLFNQDLARILSISFSVISLSLFAEIGIKLNKKIFVNVVWAVLFVFCLINLITIMIYPSGMYTTVEWTEANGDFYSNLCWFLGFKNHHLRFILPLLFFSILRSFDSKNHHLFDIQVLLSFFVAVASSALGKSATVIIGTSVMVLFYFIFRFFGNHLEIRFVIGFNVVLFILLMIGSSGGELLLNIADSLFDKASTLKERFNVWQRALTSLENHLIFGFGRQPNQTKIAILGFNNTHNSFLETLYTGGLVGLGLFLWQLFMIVKPMDTIKSDYRLYNLISFTLFAFLIVSQSETAFFENSLFFLLTCAYFLPNEFNKTKSVERVRGPLNKYYRLGI